MTTMRASCWFAALFLMGMLDGGEAFARLAEAGTRRAVQFATAPSQQQNPFDMMQALLKDKMSDLQKLAASSSGSKANVASFAGESEIVAAVQVLERAAETKSEDPEAVLTQLLALEKLMRARNAFDGDATSRETFEMLDGSWRLIFTTGTIDTQKKIGKINYFPIKAVQSFDTAQMKISNGIFLGDFALLKFFGPWSWVAKVSRTSRPNPIALIP